MTTEQKSKTSTDLKAEANAEQKRSREIGKRADQIPGELQQAKSDLQRERSRAARAGEDLQAATAPIKERIANLEAELEDAPEHAFAARIRSLELDVQAKTVFMAEKEPEAVEAEKAYREVHEEANEVRQREDAANRKRSVIASQIEEARMQRKQLSEALDEVEEIGPRRRSL